MKNKIIAGLVVVSGVLGVNSLHNSTNQVNTNVSNNTVAQLECITADEAWEHIGDTGCVEYFVSNPYKSRKGNVFLNEKRDYKNGFTTAIFNKSIGMFDNPIDDYGDETIQTTGLIKMYKGHPEIIVDDFSQIKVK